MPVARLPEVLDAPFCVDLVAAGAKLVDYGLDGLPVTLFRHLDRESNSVVHPAEERVRRRGLVKVGKNELPGEGGERLDPILLIDDLRSVPRREAVQARDDPVQVGAHGGRDDLRLGDGCLQRRIGFRVLARQLLKQGALRGLRVWLAIRFGRWI
jgi:hypothetical protein